MTIITNYDDTTFHRWYAMADEDIDGLTLVFADTELEAYEKCYQILVYEDLERYLYEED